MTHRGTVRNGAIVLDQPSALPDGCRVECILIEVSSQDCDSALATGKYQGLMAFAGSVKDLPADVSENVDHYLYGHPKQ